MQPTLVLSAPHAGILTINGRFAGEISSDYPLLRPVGSQGAVYLDYRPLSGACRSMARKLVFSGGEPMQESVEAAEDLNVIIWPGGTVEIELTPQAREAAPHHFQLAGRNFTLDAGVLYCEGQRLASLPEDAQTPEYRPVSGGIALIGRCRGGQYLLTLDDGLQRQTGFLRAHQLEVEADGRIRAVVGADDLVGHATLESWKLTHEGLMLLGSEPAWANGQPAWPSTPGETVRAMVEAALAGLDAEAEGYLAPGLRSRGIPAALRDRCSLCVEMKYAPPDCRPCVGLLQLMGDRLARVQALYYRASASGGPQGPWQIDELEHM